MRTEYSTQADWSKPVRDQEEAWAIAWEKMAAYTGVPITGFNLRKKGDGWLLTVKARSAQRGDIVCFVGGNSPSEAVAEFISLSGKNKGLTWKPDKFVKG